jgi:hypothetical protein
MVAVDSRRRRICGGNQWEWWRGNFLQISIEILQKIDSYRMTSTAYGPLTSPWPLERASTPLWCVERDFPLGLASRGLWRALQRNYVIRDTSLQKGLRDTYTIELVFSYFRYSTSSLESLFCGPCSGGVGWRGFCRTKSSWCLSYKFSSLLTFTYFLLPFSSQKTGRDVTNLDPSLPRV